MMIDIEDSFDCGNHGDDTVYDLSRCRAYDEHLCHGTATNWDADFPVACDDLAWCAHFCGRECRGGTGGLCLLKLVSALSTTCDAVSARVEGLRGDPGRLDASHALAAPAKGGRDPLLHHAASLDGGCGFHALCEDCTGDCKVPMVQEYFLELFGEASPTPAIAPAPNVKYALFAQPVETCSHFGLLSDAAKPYAKQAPAIDLDPGTARRLATVLWVVPALVGLVLLAALLLRWRDKPWLGFMRRVRGWCNEAVRGDQGWRRGGGEGGGGGGGEEEGEEEGAGSLPKGGVPMMEARALLKSPYGAT